MAGSVNKVILIGNLGADPEIKTFQNGGRVCNLKVATSETWKDKQSGELKERTEWHRVTVHAEHAVKFAEGYLRKGSKVYIEGQIETRKWQDQSGQDRYSTEVCIRPYRGEIVGLGDGGSDRQDRGVEHSASGDGDSGKFGGGGFPDDEIPF